MILVLRALGVGDLATGVPALRGVRRAFPGRRLVLAAPAWLGPLVALTGAVDELLRCAGLDDPPRATRPDVAVNLHGKGPQSHDLLRSTRPARLLAFGGSGPRWTDEEHEVTRWCRMLAWYGIPCDPEDLGLELPPAPVTGVTIVHPGAKSVSRRWPAERFAAVTRALVRAGHDVVVTGSAAEQPLAARVAELAGLPGRAVLAGRTGLRDLAGLVGHARLLVSGDTGVAHLATAYRTPSVVLFGPMPPDRWGPPPDRPWHRAIWHGRTAEPGDRGDEPHPALLAVTPDEVLSEALLLPTVA
ncbi:glycosyltransferase family 9 protein [Dactylosporangium roseum]|uniref:Glycosyltransferase family 9 protein n=1 Tax=Dactylosporangium roseum TaxID=47989 RepID=A0ABY5YWE9_9ACTN|nr:glycosyltransferase family 9 protein [Dactylosporangium roseum]UWZ34059.1 glycosyltransferase family 9 protein [Dactylosporangium roseum]